jgi:cytochrome c peroxidase
MQAANLFRSSLRRSIANNTSNNARFAIRQRVPAARTYSTIPPPLPSAGKSNTALYVGLGVLLAAGAGYYVFTSSDPNAREAATALKSGVQSAKSKLNYVPTKEDYQKVYNRISAILDEAGEYDGKLLCVYDPVKKSLITVPDGSYGPVLVRLAWHSSGTYDKDTKTGGRYPSQISSAFTTLTSLK